jgi:hypothetical protein
MVAEHDKQHAAFGVTNAPPSMHAFLEPPKNC